MTTTAQHANTVREAIRREYWEAPRQLAPLLAALDALQAQAEQEQRKAEEAVVMYRKAEAERDRLLVDARAEQQEYDELERERDRLRVALESIADNCRAWQGGIAREAIQKFAAPEGTCDPDKSGAFPEGNDGASGAADEERDRLAARVKELEEKT